MGSEGLRKWQHLVGVRIGPQIINIPSCILKKPNIPNKIIPTLQTGKCCICGQSALQSWLEEAEAGVQHDQPHCLCKHSQRQRWQKSRVRHWLLSKRLKLFISIFSGQLLFNRVMHLKLEEGAFPAPALPPPPQLPHGLGGISMCWDQEGNLFMQTTWMIWVTLDLDGTWPQDGLPWDLEEWGLERLGHVPVPIGLGRISEMGCTIGGKFERYFPKNSMGKPHRFWDAPRKGNRWWLQLSQNS